MLRNVFDPHKFRQFVLVFVKRSCVTHVQSAEFLLCLTMSAMREIALLVFA